ncbi:MAG: redox-regulated ATPase YchF [Clostridiales bacterium]|nr:redox-regulated ATPase YchF [Clostridiales bacterium]
MRLGIVGLPNVGKSTLFNSLTNLNIASENYPFCTIEPNKGIVNVPDERLIKLADLYNCNNIVHATVEFVDIAGLIKGASNGEGLGNKFLSHIREVDAILHVVRCFENNDIIHVSGNINVFNDVEVVNIELILSDIEFLEKKMNKYKKDIKKDKSIEKELNILNKIKIGLENNVCARNLKLNDEEFLIAKKNNLLSLKPVLYVANLDESNFNKKNIYVNEIEKIANKDNSFVIKICVKLEQEISELNLKNKKIFLEELGLEKSGLDRLIRESYNLLGMISFLTAGPKETRAWTIFKNTRIVKAAGKIHSDFERGFIKAEVIDYDDLIRCHSITEAKSKGLVRIEGKEYIVKDGDVIVFRFNV